MANDKKFITKNGLVTQNVEYLSPDRDSTINLEMLDSDTLSWEGDSGQLFSITDSLTGVIFSVNDISGVPSIEVDDDGTIRFAEFAGNVLIGTATDDGTNKLQVDGSVAATSFSGDGSDLTNVDADQLDGEDGSYYLNYNNFTNTPSLYDSGDFDSDFSGKDTDDLSEGSSNLYFTNARVDARIGDGTLTVEGGDGLTGSGTFDANQTDNETITIDHADTSSQGSVNNSGTTVIQDISLDGFGHVTDLGSTTLSAASFSLGTSDDVEFDSLGVGTSASGTSGEIRATGDITAHFSDDRLKTKLGVIEDALAKVNSLEGFYYEPNDTAVELGYERKRMVGVSAQSVQNVLPEAVKAAPISDEYLTVQYEKLVPMLIEAVKTLSARVDELEGKR